MIKQMVLLAILLIGISFAEIKKYNKKGRKKELIVFFAAISATFAMGVFYLSNPQRNSFAKILFDILHVPH